MLEVGQFAPNFALTNQDGKIVHLSDFRGQRVVVFTFLRAGSIACTMQACSLRDIMPRLARANTVVLGISIDRTSVLKAWKVRDRLPYDLLTDPNHQVLDNWGAWGTSLVGFMLPAPKRSLWILDADGRLIEKHLPVGIQSGEIALKALRQMDGELAAAAGGR